MKIFSNEKPCLQEPFQSKNKPAEVRDMTRVRLRGEFGGERGVRVERGEMGAWEVERELSIVGVEGELRGSY